VEIHTNSGHFRTIVLGDAASGRSRSIANNEYVKSVRESVAGVSTHGWKYDKALLMQLNGEERTRIYIRARKSDGTWSECCRASQKIPKRIMRHALCSI